MTNVWFITGSARGLGRAIAEKALATGAKVVATARHTDALADLVSQYGDNLLPLQLDVTDEDAVNKAIKTAQTHFGSVDVLVNNAGYAQMAATEEMSTADFKAQMDTDFYGTLFTIRAVLPIMRLQKAGRIINISSIGGRVGGPGLSAYQSAKFAVNGLTEVVASEVTPFNIQVTTVEPGGMRTDWGGKSMSAVQSDVYAETVGQWIKLVHDGWDAENDPDHPRYVSEPAKVADAIYTLSEMPKAPTHLLIGKDAQASAKQHAEALAKSDAENAALTESTGNM
ncbi:short-chain dehydrogenase/reductase [Secundilactobacillus paracollinoides]|uniref:Short-chain dehydrogenase/reductase n=1 Tax=Secundilactobacillus paracollinoides TaxID=240427 RepID=A0A1B2J0E3_9LACO|nr:SDR family NAD(P)-dependent oxidoreductase [Secundilactobacillus paracollinoides]ANZ61886.1 short-chain dehydrogenase/reductase [Secundilactobacillus paracollinoides]ANZ63525.1 short-chain dehydrogenase/reductase [Secundilactobacillus paracollinoides]ANZ67806.1 short-chain dehydrogenase/reductase [Secundilactobacillus paracollinoides]